MPPPHSTASYFVIPQGLQTPGACQTGGLSPLYQIGGPRSAQLALKLIF
jgi:hypothetical protein